MSAYEALNDIAISTLKKLEPHVGDLDPAELARLQGVCSQIVDKATKLRGGAGRVDTANKTPAQIEAENNEFFGIEDAPAPKAEAKRAPAPAKAEAEKAAGTGQRISKYIDTERTEVIKPATEEADVSDEEWNDYYRKRFGRDPDLTPLVDDDIPRPPPGPGEEDDFREVRIVQSKAKEYESPEAYYEALNAAISAWKEKRKAKGGLIGAAVSDRYMDQLRNMKPFEEAQEGQNFQLGCMLVEEKGEDADGNEVGILVFTSIDKSSTLSPLGLDKGDALLAINGSDVTNYKDLKREIGKIHAAGKLSAEVTVQKAEKGIAETFLVHGSG